MPANTPAELKPRSELRRLITEADDCSVGLHNLGLSMKHDECWQISSARIIDAARIMKALAKQARDAWEAGYGAGQSERTEA